jgi:YbgC/YbaW family acyl-CoA thioester hydrolase
MAKQDFRCEHRLRVRWAEVDMQKIVFNGHYLTYIDTAVAEYWRAVGLPYPEGYIERYGNDMFLRKATVEYLGSARFDDELCILVRTSRLGGSSLRFLFEILRLAPAPSSDPLVTAELVYVNADPTTMKAAPLPAELRERIRAYETLAPEEA